MPRRHYIYIPFKCDTSIASHKDVWDSSQQMVSHFLQKNPNEHPHILYFGATKDEHKLSKRKFGKEDVLYINSHGNQKQIGTANDDVNIDPGQLASRLSKDGLDQNVAHVKVAACYSAKGYDQKRGKKGGNTSFSSHFCAALYKQNYKKATVYGYTDGVTSHDHGYWLPLWGYITAGTHAYVGDKRASDPSVRKQFKGARGDLV
jgi:hypothetical protein